MPRFRRSSRRYPNWSSLQCKCLVSTEVCPTNLTELCFFLPRSCRPKRQEKVNACCNEGGRPLVACLQWMGKWTAASFAQRLVFPPVMNRRGNGRMKVWRLSWQSDTRIMLDTDSVKQCTSWHLHRTQYEKSWASQMSDDTGRHISERALLWICQKDENSSILNE